MMGLMDIGEEELSVVHLPDPIVLELNHLQNQLKGLSLSFPPKRINNR